MYEDTLATPDIKLTADELAALEPYEKNGVKLARRIAELASHVLTPCRSGQWTDDRTYLFAHTGETGLHRAEGGHGGWMVTSVGTAESKLNTFCDVQSFFGSPADHSPQRALVIVGVGKWCAVQTYINATASDETIREVLTILESAFWTGYNRDAEDRAAEKLRNATEEPASGPNEDEPTNRPDGDDDSRKQAIEAELLETMFQHNGGQLDDEELDERMETISGLITSWGSCPLTVAEYAERFIDRIAHRDYDDAEIQSGLSRLRSLVMHRGEWK